NKHKIDKQQLKPGDILRVGNSQLRLEAAPDSAGEKKKKSGVLPRVPATAAPPASPQERLGRMQGQVLGHFHIGELLATSAVRAVYEAHDMKSNRDIALKILTPQFPATATELENFAGVLHKALPLRHEHLVTLLG